MREKNSKLDRQKEQAIAALLAKPTIEEAAAAAGIGYATLRRWLQDAGFSSSLWCQNDLGIHRPRRGDRGPSGANSKT